MLLLCAVFALLTAGFVIPCAVDIAMTPSHHFALPSRQTWLIVCVAFWAFGAAAWLLVGRRDVRMRAVCDEVTGNWMGNAELSLWTTPNRGAGLGYRAGVNRPGARRPSRPTERAAMVSTHFVAPDDNPDFLQELERRIRDGRND